jgi:hypothetical protein
MIQINRMRLKTRIIPTDSGMKRPKTRSISQEENRKRKGRKKAIGSVQKGERRREFIYPSIAQKVCKFQFSGIIEV